MLTGDELPSAGTARLGPNGGFDIIAQPASVRKLMGYCPQHDALHLKLTGRETLQFYGRLRGIPEERLTGMVNNLIERLSLGDYADREAGKYSGGNKRKLSVGIALIGNPPIVFLDEPTTGIDPVSRRYMWDFISETMAKRAVILTTHSMEECEALCSRIGIIGNGQLCCIGTSQHLKQRFGRGLQLHISTGAQELGPAKDFILEHFPQATALEAYGNNLKYQIDTKMSLPEVFTLIEKNREAANIAEYSVGQTTLEQIFLNFAKASELETLSEEARQARGTVIKMVVRDNGQDLVPEDEAAFETIRSQSMKSGIAMH